MADNSKYVTQLRRETTRMSVKAGTPKATITRHATSWALSKKAIDAAAAASHEPPPLQSRSSQVTQFHNHTPSLYTHLSSLLYHLCLSL